MMRSAQYKNTKFMSNVTTALVSGFSIILSILFCSFLWPAIGKVIIPIFGLYILLGIYLWFRFPSVRFYLRLNAKIYVMLFFSYLLIAFSVLSIACSVWMFGEANRPYAFTLLTVFNMVGSPIAMIAGISLLVVGLIMLFNNIK
jgi:hypothetical protein